VTGFEEGGGRYAYHVIYQLIEKTQHGGTRLDAYLGLVIGPERLGEVLGLGEHALGDVGVDGV
jgi:hypothetical protein